MEFGISISKILYLFVFGCFASTAFMNYGSNAELIPEDEVKVLETISSKIGNLNWNVTPRSCVDGGFKNETISTVNSIIRNVTCNCSFSNGTVCHVTNIVFTGLNLSGLLPSEFGFLAYLQELCLKGNLISGPIPDEIGEITTLEDLELRDSLLEGTLPSSLGTLKQLRKLDLSGNNFFGAIPESFGNLKNLEYIYLVGTNISEKLPNFIGDWTQLQEMGISDLHGPTMMRFPNLENLTSLQTLVLRNCFIHDSIPNYISKMEK